MPTPASPDRLFARRLSEDAGRPLVTYYDQRTGERAELSAKSLANWVAKTYFLLTDEVGVGDGDRAIVRLPMHWFRYVVWLGAWSAGMTVVDAAPGEAAFAHDATDLAQLTGACDEVYGLALAPWGRGYPDAPPAGTSDFVAAVRPQPDLFAQVRPIGTGDAVPDVSRPALAERAAARAMELGMGAEARLLMPQSSAAADDPATWLAPLAVPNGSIVLVVADDADATERIAATERTTASA